MVRLILVAAFIALLRTTGASGQDTEEPFRSDGTLPLGDELEASDGTLPLRLPSDGTLPLRLSGAATGVGGQRLETLITITQAIQRALTDAQGTAFLCQSEGDTISKHTAAGSVAVGGQSFTIKGICYNHANRALEVVAERRIGGAAVEQSFVVATLIQPEPRSLAGRLTITGQQARSYSLNVSSLDEGGPVE